MYIDFFEKPFLFSSASITYGGYRFIVNGNWRFLILYNILTLCFVYAMLLLLNKYYCLFFVIVFFLNSTTRLKQNKKNCLVILKRQLKYFNNDDDHDDVDVKSAKINIKFHKNNNICAFVSAWTA